jgi:hypothetical protein
MAGDVTRAVEHSRGSGSGIYRGGTLRPAEYRALHSALAARGIQLLTTLGQFENAQLFPRFFPQIAEFSLPAVTTTSLDPADVRLFAHSLGPPPYFLKDYVKSAKEIWPKGCVVPAPGSVEQFAQTIRELREFRGERFESGLVPDPSRVARGISMGKCFAPDNSCRSVIARIF